METNFAENILLGKLAPRYPERLGVQDHYPSNRPYKSRDIYIHELREDR